MGKKLFLLGVIAAITVVAGAQSWFSGARNAYAAPGDDFGDKVIITSTGGTIALGPVKTEVDTFLGAPGGGFYSAIGTISKGITAGGAVPVGDVVGSGSFHIRTGTVPCSTTGGTIGATYSLYSAKLNATTAGLPVGFQWGQGGPLSEPGYSTLPFTSAAYDKSLWVADFPDDNLDNIPDYALPGPNYAAGNSFANTIEDWTQADGVTTNHTDGRAPNPANDGVPDGVTQEPIYIPQWLATAGLPAPVARYFGVAVVLAGTLEVPVDFVNFANFPSTGVNMQIPAIQEGSGVGLTPSLPANPGTSGLVQCTPFDSTITLNATSTPGGATVQSVTGSGYIEVHMRLPADTDGDGIPNSDDNCDQVPNPNQADGDSDGIGDVCDPAPATPAAADADGDQAPNGVDSCPFSSNPNDGDHDGVADGCDLAPTIPGDGKGYGFLPTGSAVPIGGAATAPQYGAFQVMASINNFPFAVGDASPSTIAQKWANIGVTGGEVYCLMATAELTENPGMNCDASPDLNGDGAPDSIDLTADSDGDTWPDGCETGFALYGKPGEGSDALDASSTPNTAAIQARLGGGVPTPTDCDGDGTPNATDATPLGVLYDSDGDHCSDAKEPTHASGTKAGDPFNPWDFYSVPVATLRNSAVPFPTDTGIGVTTDVKALLTWTAAPGPKWKTLAYDSDVDLNGIPDGVQYDRAKTSKYSGNWPGAADNGVGVTTDVPSMLAQAGPTFNC